MATKVNGTMNPVAGQNGTTTHSNDPGEQALMVLIGSLDVEKVVDSRIVQISLGCLSAVMAIVVIFRIWRDSWRSQKLNGREEQVAWLHQLHPAESFPLILGFGILLQQLLFISIQATMINYLTVTDCKETGMFIVPGILGVAFLHLIFGIEMTFRALRGFPTVAKRYLFTPLINVGCVWLLIIGTILICKFTGFDAKSCYGGILFLAGSLRLNSTMIGLISAITFLFLVMALIIMRQLSRSVHLDPNERVAGTRMVYYLVLAACINVFILPYFVKALQPIPDLTILTAANVAEYALFSSGFVIALLHLFLRANAAKTAIKAKETPWHTNRRWRFFGPSELEIINISPPLNLVNPNYRPDEKISEIFSRRLLSNQRKTSFPASTPLGNYPNSLRPLDTSRGRFPVLPRKISNTTTETPTTGGLTPGLQAPISTTTAAPKPTPPMNNRKSSVYTLWPGAEEARRGSENSPIVNLPPPKQPPPTAPLPQVPFAIYTPPNPGRGPSAMRPVTRNGRAPSTGGFEPSSLPGSGFRRMSDIQDRFSSRRNSSLHPPAQPWAQLTHRREMSMESSLSGTVPIGIRLSTAPNARISETPGTSTYPSRLGSTIEFGQASIKAIGSGHPLPAFNESLTQALQEQARDARGRDLNSFRWIDSPTEDIVDPSGKRPQSKRHDTSSSIGALQHPVSGSSTAPLPIDQSKTPKKAPSISSITSRYSTSSIQQSPRFKEQGHNGGRGPWI